MHLGYGLLTLFPGRVGGSEANVRGLLAEYAAGHGPEQVTVLANRHVLEPYGRYARGPVELRHVRSYRPGDGGATRTLAMAGAALAPRIAARDVPAGLDVLHLPVTVPIPQVSGVPTVVTVYDLQHRELPGFFGRAERIYRRWAYEGSAREADLVVTTSEYSRERLIALAGVAPDRVECVYMGIDHERFVPGPVAGDADQLAELALPERFVVYPANLWPHKNHERLVDALAAVDGLHLVLTGQDYGKLDALAERARRAGVEDRVHHLGFLEPEQVPALYRAARAMVFPSLYEGFGSPPLEAMACNCPVACSTRGSLAEVVGDAALTFDPESVAAIGAALRRVDADEGLRDELAERGRQRAARFTWGTAARRHLELYERGRSRRIRRISR